MNPENPTVCFGYKFNEQCLKSLNLDTLFRLSPDKGLHLGVMVDAFLQVGIIFRLQPHLGQLAEYEE